MAKLETKEIIVEEHVLILNDVELSMIYKLVSNTSGATAVANHGCTKEEADSMYPLYEVIRPK
jgi:hypothetical protein